MPPIRLSILTDDPFFRQGVQQVLQSDPALLVSDTDGAAGGGPPSEHAADVVLVDSRMEGALAHCAARDSDQRPYLIFLTVAGDAAAADALRLGARGVLRRTDDIIDVVPAIRTVHAGSIWAPRAVIVEALRRGPRTAFPLEQRLSAREYEVARCVAKGLSNKELAGRLGISLATVKTHLTRIFQKLNLHGRGELAAAFHGTLVIDSPINGLARLHRQPPDRLTTYVDHKS